MTHDRPAHVLALFEPAGIWSRIAVDAETFRPLEDQARAIGPVMDRSFSRLDSASDIRSPL